MSFISLKLVLPAVVALLKPRADLAVLVKPQFEAGRDHVKKGIVRDEAVHRAVCEDMTAFVASLGFTVIGSSPRPSKAGTATANSYWEPAVAEQVIIKRLGAKADGIAETSSGPVFVPKVLPGETVTIERDGSHAHLVSVDVPSPERETPFCPYFDDCGGCATQHMQHGFYQAWKHGTLVHTLRQARIEAPVEALVDAHGEGRRRVTLHVRFPDRAMHVGFMAPRSHTIVEIAFCPIAEPALKDQAPAIARAIGEHLKGAAQAARRPDHDDADRLRRGCARARPHEGCGPPAAHRSRGQARSRRACRSMAT